MVEKNLSLKQFLGERSWATTDKSAKPWKVGKDYPPYGKVISVKDIKKGEHVKVVFATKAYEFKKDPYDPTKWIEESFESLPGDRSFNSKPDLKGTLKEAFEGVVPYTGQVHNNQRAIHSDEMQTLLAKIPSHMRGSIKEAGLSSQAKKRMKGLVNVSNIAALKNSLNSIFADLTDEGFESEEVKAFVMLYVDLISKSYR